MNYVKKWDIIIKGDAKMATRSELREKIMIILYQYDLDDIIKENIEVVSDFVKDIVYGVITNKEQIDKIANEHMRDWNIERIDKTGGAILRMGIYELKYTDTPHVVVINEAVELAKKFSDDKVRKIINAVLDNIIKE